MPTISLIIHVTAAAVLVGPQILMFFAVVPATWLIEDDEKLKRAVLKVVAGRFGMLAGVAIVTLLVTGLYQYYTIVPEHVRAAPNDYMFGIIFSIKMLLFVTLIVLIYLHTFRYSKKIATLSDQVIALESDPSSARREEGRRIADDLERARQKSFGFSTFILLASLLTLWFGVALGHESFAWAQLG